MAIETPEIAGGTYPPWAAECACGGIVVASGCGCIRPALSGLSIQMAAVVPCESGCPGQARTSAGMTISLRVQRRSRVARLPLLAPENIEPCNDDDCRATECEGIRDIAEH